MIATFQVHKQTYGRWPAKNGKAAGESFDVDLIDMSLPAEHAYRGVLPYRLSPDEKDKYWGKLDRKFVEVGIHEIQHTPRGPVLRGLIMSVKDKYGFDAARPTLFRSLFRFLLQLCPTGYLTAFSNSPLKRRMLRSKTASGLHRSTMPSMYE